MLADRRTTTSLGGPSMRRTGVVLLAAPLVAIDGVAARLLR